jgi:hypothetical protein
LKEKITKKVSEEAKYFYADQYENLKKQKEIEKHQKELSQKGRPN